MTKPVQPTQTAEEVAQQCVMYGNQPHKVAAIIRRAMDGAELQGYQKGVDHAFDAASSAALSERPAADEKLEVVDEWTDAEDCDPTHAAMCSRAVRWLINMGCRCAVKEITTVSTTEICDAVGFKDDTCIVVEVKTSRADFLRDAKKSHRGEGKGMGAYRYFMAPAGMIKPDEVPEGWGLVEVSGKICRVVKGLKQLRPYHDELPFPNSNKRAEIGLLTSLVRRLRDGDPSALRIATRQHPSRQPLPQQQPARG